MLISVLLSAACSSAILSPAPMDRLTGKHFATRSVVYAQEGMAATSHPLATQAALQILQAGGNAVDAAIAANALLGFAEPTGNGMGGDIFAILWDAKTQKLHGYNGSGRSPASLTAEHFKELGLSTVPKRGPLPVSVPGCVDGWFALHERFGKSPMSSVLAPAIHYARKGAPVPQTIAYWWGKNAAVLSEFEGFSETFLPEGRCPEEGEVFANPRLARTLELLAEGGRDVFYKGEIAERIVEYMQRQGGFLTMADLAAHQGEWVDPVSVSYRGAELWELPPNGQGVSALQMLNILEGFDLSEMGFGSADHLHVLTEAKKLAFADRARWFSDPAFTDLPLDRLLSKDYAKELRARINMQRAANIDLPDPEQIERGDTIYLCTADKHGNMVSLIQSNYRGMGSGMTPGDLGFILQNRGELFDLTPGRPNSYAPKKRPFHTIIPAFATKDGKPWLAFGVMGGATQPQAHVQIMCNLLDFGMNLQEAGDAPRLVHSGSSQPTGERMRDGGELYLETGFASDSVRELVERGHRVMRKISPFGGYQAIAWEAHKKVYAGASESRKDGQAAGY